MFLAELLQPKTSCWTQTLQWAQCFKRVDKKAGNFHANFLIRKEFFLIPQRLRHSPFRQCGLILDENWWWVSVFLGDWLCHDHRQIQISVRVLAHSDILDFIEGKVLQKIEERPFHSSLGHLLIFGIDVRSLGNSCPLAAEDGTAQALCVWWWWDHFVFVTWEGGECQEFSSYPMMLIFSPSCLLNHSALTLKLKITFTDFSININWRGFFPDLSRMVFSSILSSWRPCFNHVILILTNNQCPHYQLSRNFLSEPLQSCLIRRKWFSSCFTSSEWNSSCRSRARPNHWKIFYSTILYYFIRQSLQFKLFKSNFNTQENHDYFL